MPVVWVSGGAALEDGSWLPTSEVGALDASPDVITVDSSPVGWAELTTSVEGSGAVFGVDVTGAVVDDMGTVVEVGPGAVGCALEDGAAVGVGDAVVVVDAAGIVLGSEGCEQPTTPPNPTTQRSRNLDGSPNCSPSARR